MDRASNITAPGYHGDGQGLYLHMTPRGSKSWVYRFRWKGKLKDMGLGPFPSVLPEDARAERDKWRRVLQVSKLNPIEERRRERERNADQEAQKAAEEAEAAEAQARAADNAFGTCALNYVDTHEKSWRNTKHRAQWRSTLETYCAPIWTTPIADIGTNDVLRILSPIWHLKPETASRIRGRMERVFAAAKVLGLRTGENPARWRENLKELLADPENLKRSKTKGHFNSMPFERVGAFVAQLRDVEGVSALALEYLILAASRTGEVTGMTWQELDLEKDIWTIPGSRMKGKAEHRVPITPRMREILEIIGNMKESHSASGSSGYVFLGAKAGRPLSNMAMAMQLRRCDPDGRFTVHGFRSSFRDWVGDKTTFPRELAELSIAHKVKGKTEKSYWRSDALEKRRPLMEAWGRYVGGSSDGKVVQLRKSSDQPAA